MKRRLLKKVPAQRNWFCRETFMVTEAAAAGGLEASAGQADG